jgi:hypothetical protein
MSDIKTARQVQVAIQNHDRYSAAAEARHKKQMADEKARLESYEDLRDDVLSVLKNHNISFEEVHGRLGPHPSTLTSWATGAVHQPQLRKMQSALRTVGYDIGIIEGSRRKETSH